MKKGLVIGLLVFVSVLLVFSLLANGSSIKNWMANVGGDFMGKGNNNNNGDNNCPGSNPSVGLSFTNALTGQSVVVSSTNIKDANTQRLLGAGYSAFMKNQQDIFLVNASGYISEIQPTITINCGSQSLQGDLYQFANETIQIYNNAGTSTIGGATSSTGNDTAFTTQANNKIILTGNTFKSSSRMFVIYEIANTTSVSSATLSQNGNSNPIQSILVPNCHTNTLTGTLYRTAFEIPAIVGGNQVTYNLQTLSSNGLNVAGEAVLTIYNEKDAVDTGNGNFLSNGICDSKNTATYMDKTQNIWYYN